ncbi:S-adenosyl-L-methionine-dependent methyltransferase [Russula earlei]|uniref:S-adenosyl-L-methionine-dependent methyltransferase n=1 Tax=Russula earlei TaxID=71964 RepID=A0ACC0UJM2_9AGAM|nr:S-adenosyl-L-methionine-dependent methyltransferase [Russula earlei]
MIPTPDLSHLTKEDYKRVYEPAEDTFLLLDALEADADAIRALAPRVCLEIGSGTGIVSSFLGQIVGASDALFLCTDINPLSTACTARTGSQNKIPIEPLVASLARPLTSRLRHAVDVLVFNPPYVPTYEVEVDAAQRNGGISGSWAGGTDGMQVTDAFLRQVDGLLSPLGRFYLVAVKQNNVPKIKNLMSEVFALQSEIVLQRRAGSEHLFVLRFAR